jgi:hypothetical protein
LKLLSIDEEIFLRPIIDEKKNIRKHLISWIFQIYWVIFLVLKNELEHLMIDIQKLKKD